MKPVKSSVEAIAEPRFLGNISATALRNLLPRSLSSSKRKALSSLGVSRSNSENTPPGDPNIEASPVAAAKPKQPEPRPEIVAPEARVRDLAESDSPVKVVVRIRPPNGGEREKDRNVKKISSDTVSVCDRMLKFDSVFDSKASQEDVFQYVGVPLVRNALAGYNTSVVSYGQSGSGKTYTMWGPQSAMVDDPSPRSRQGIIPRIFHMLFSEIEKEQMNSEEKQINYQCRCSFLEIYNEQIGDLLDPAQRNLGIKDDTKNGLHVENLTEEYVTGYEDVMQILIKGLSSRKVGATSMNSKSSRSHIVFTFIIESWSKDNSSKCFGSSKTSRICLVDLAGPDKKKIDVPGSAKEGKHVKKSLARLGRLVNTLAKEAESGKPEDALYKGSCLTHLLRESFGGNSKLTVLCTISPDNNNDGEILGTLRFGERVKSIKNEPVINEITEDDVNDLSDKIRQLKEELIRAKSGANSVVSNHGYFQGRNVRDSLNLLRVSLNRSLLLPRMDNEPDVEVNINEDDVKELEEQLNKLRKSCEENVRGQSCDADSTQLAESCETEYMSEDGGVDGPEETEFEEINLENAGELPLMDSMALEDDIRGSNCSRAINSEFRKSISISTFKPVILQEPALSESPKIGKNLRKSMVLSSFSVAHSNVAENSKSTLEESRQSLDLRSSLRSSKMFAGPTESLAASLRRGLDIIDHHQRNSAAFSFEHLTLQPCPEVDKAGSPGHTFLCASCKKQVQKKDTNEVEDSLKTWIVPVDEEGNSVQSRDEAKKDMKNPAEEVTKREELENRCTEQAAKIEQLTQLIEEYKLGHHVVGMKNEIIPFEEPGNEERDEKKILRCNSVHKNQPEIIKENYEIKEVQNESVFDVNEKEELLNEIQVLISKLQSQTDACPTKSTEKLRSSLLSRSIQLRKSAVFQSNNDEELEQERQRWTEMESEWISLTDELRIDIDMHRRRAEKLETELKSEKQCTEELDDALHRAILGHARMVEHYTDLQEKHSELASKHRAIMEGIADVKRAAAKAGKKGQGTRFAKSLAAELSAMRAEREKEREFLKKENKSLKVQLRDTAEAVHAAGELLVRLREAEHSASVAEDNFANAQQDNEKLKKQIEKIKGKHKMEMVTMKQYMAESRLPESALKPLYREDSADALPQSTILDDDQAWRAEFGAIYQDHY